METLQRLTRRQLDALRIVGQRETPDRGVTLKSIASTLRVSPPSALGHLGPLESLGLVSRYRGKSRVTPKGHQALREYERHHRVAESLFSRLGLGPELSCTAAREVDLALSHATVERVCAAEGHPTVCPHGEPISPCPSSKKDR
ncbi:MAG TPA: metal-dependent transcriptional regulator [Thermoplasmata archaeon]|nr:metal-dependent transcriptional regulator [Thermoplasmata archaeon]